ncbi:MAG: DNA (cytosine-5-)-methyltransferase [Nitrospirae bacterium GWC2_46_6]|nr:MAG: DNA (cytosine-5-)-methyltransferase [Nitrospirae bacterium GWC2_46_6]OGW21448.1 MAG: DNA (cytosine-5-)-methyltransferase [Nitrospirae bacterium GWA2_46_11]OGW24839.1 MAG: DNA (cytosine-5-)-methyltransferase [Nitrospirae bacterium GWB2_47_37]HAK88166.1 DNA (cytosine-5-)-methyltransferase [Nitrospiraceae bacterium]HCL81084.1 DNA (cytosine-5-)-methyltransferase [Nitrospiraceae bacterium]
MSRNKKLPGYRLVDLFCGAGGLTLGFSQFFGQIFVPVWANDFNPYAAKTYEKNFGCRCTTDDILEITEKRINEIPKADVVIGGPPCQGFSLLNKGRKDDSRKQLWRPYLQIVEHTGAQIFVMENVPQLIGSEEHKEIIEVAGSIGFKLAWAKLCAADYGVPQTRMRAFIIGCKFTDPSRFFPPKKTHQKPAGLKADPLFQPIPWRTIRDAIGDLPKPVGTEIRDEPPPLDLHFGRTPTPLSLKRYKTISKEGMNRFDLQRLAPELTPACWIRKTQGGTDLFGRLWWDRPAFTIRTEFFKPEKGRYLHPDQHRPITHREAARLQSFPDSFSFIGSKTEIAKQIGNAVPPMLAAGVADSVLSLFMSRETEYNGQVHKTKKSANYGEYQGTRYVAGKVGTQLP